MRSNALKKLALLRKDHAALEAELAAYGDSNPAKVEELKRAAFLGKEAAYRWTGSFLSFRVRHRTARCTDNYGMLLGYFTRQSGISVSDIREYLCIGEEYEDLN
jgi:hypothetical protein